MQYKTLTLKSYKKLIEIFNELDLKLDNSNDKNFFSSILNIVIKLITTNKINELLDLLITTDKEYDELTEEELVDIFVNFFQKKIQLINTKLSSLNSVK